MSRTFVFSGRLWFALLSLAALGLILIAGFMFLRPRSVVDWTTARVVVIESDDWGFCGFTPDIEKLDLVDLAAIEPGVFPDIYLHSTLETAADVDRMVRLLKSHLGRDGLPAVIQPNYIMGSLTYDPVPGGDSWQRAVLPELPDNYRRPDLWVVVADAIRAGVWWPEYHGLWHYNPDDRRESVKTNEEVKRAASEGLLFFPGMDRSFELSLDRDPDVLVDELGEGLEVFESLFDRRAYSVIAPDYAWDRTRERMWFEAGVGIVQAKREQRSLTKPSASIWDRLWKVGERSWRHLTERRLIYLNRNCRLEGAQAADPALHAAICLQHVQSAWHAGEPAIIGTHRVNYAHLDPGSADIGFNTLDHVLTVLDEDPHRRPIYLTDHEVAQLMRSGTSARNTGDRIVLRNLTHSRRLVLLPGPAGEAPRVTWLSPGSNSSLVFSDHSID